MKIRKFSLVIISTIIIISSYTSIAKAETDNIDTLYKNAYNATQDALRSGSQEYINIARAEVKKLPKNMDWAIGEFSKKIDTVQHYILSKIVISIKTTENNLIQANINAAREYIPIELNTSWKNSYSAAIDKLQQKLQKGAVEALKKAENDKSEESIKVAAELISELMSSHNQAIVDWTLPLSVRVESLGGVITDGKSPDRPYFPSKPEPTPEEKPKPIIPSGMSLKPREIEKYLGNFDLYLYSTVFGDPKHGANYRASSHNFEVSISDSYLEIKVFKNSSLDEKTIQSVLEMALPTSYKEIYDLSKNKSSDVFLIRDGRKIQIYKGTIVVDYNKYD